MSYRTKVKRTYFQRAFYDLVGPICNRIFGGGGGSSEGTHSEAVNRIGGGSFTGEDLTTFHRSRVTRDNDGRDDDEDVEEGVSSSEEDEVAHAFGIVIKDEDEDAEEEANNNPKCAFAIAEAAVLAVGVAGEKSAITDNINVNGEKQGVLVCRSPQ